MLGKLFEGTVSAGEGVLGFESLAWDGPAEVAATVAVVSADGRREVVSTADGLVLQPLPAAIITKAAATVSPFGVLP